MGFFKWIDDARTLWEYVCYGQFGEEVPSPSVEQKVKTVYPPARDRNTPNLYVGKIIDDGSIKCEVVDVHQTNIHIKILEIKWDRMGTYLDVGKVYPVFKHSGWNDKTIQVWEIASKHMKRSTSQVIFQWEEGLGWTWDLDM